MFAFYDQLLSLPKTSVVMKVVNVADDVAKLVTFVRFCNFPPELIRACTEPIFSST